jgi:mRNA interferase HigB
MWIVSKKMLPEFWQVPGREKSQGPLLAWYKHVEFARWASWSDVKADYRTADVVGHCTVFNIGGNKCRLIARVLFECHKVFVLKVMTHEEYGGTDWKTECRCYSPPPKRKGS